MGAQSAGLGASQRPLLSMRTKAAGGVERRPLQPQTQAAAAAPAGRGTWRSPLGGAGTRRLGPLRLLQLDRADGPAPTPAGSALGSAPPDEPGAGLGGAWWSRAWPTGRGRGGCRRCGRGGGAGAGPGPVAGPPQWPLGSTRSAAARDLIHCWKLPSPQGRVQSSLQDGVGGSSAGSRAALQPLSTSIAEARGAAAAGALPRPLSASNPAEQTPWATFRWWLGYCERRLTQACLHYACFRKVFKAHRL